MSLIRDVAFGASHEVMLSACNFRAEGKKGVPCRVEPLRDCRVRAYGLLGLERRRMRNLSGTAGSFITARLKVFYLWGEPVCFQPPKKGD